MSAYNYKIQVFGDSIHWGQGLKDDQKMAYLLSQKLHSKNSKIKTQIVTNAHSGAIIGTSSNTSDTGLHGEVPRTYPTILGQVDLAEGKQDTNLILTNGGINDVDVANILNPKTSTSWIKSACKEMCHDRMTVLLNKILDDYPQNTQVIVTGYYQIVSNFTLLNPALLFFLPIPIGLLESVLFEKIVANSIAFGTEANKQLSLAVNEVSKKTKQEDWICRSWVWTKQRSSCSNYLISLWAESNRFTRRSHGRRETKKCPNSSILDHTKCLRASAGHPNPKGEAQYAEQIFKTFTANWSIPSV